MHKSEMFALSNSRLEGININTYILHILRCKLQKKLFHDDSMKWTWETSNKYSLVMLRLHYRLNIFK